jgi:non-specific serine/threonine protein kinase
MIRDPGAKERFVHEAKSASALDHPNICTIHEIGETNDGQSFIAMACYEGEPLNEKIARGAMRVEEAVDIAIQVASGLFNAHEKGIVHRDIKPANIIITNDGVVKILDFGLAKLAGQSRLTKTGSTIGTAAYMSPEQAQGLEVDHRTDIWSLGVVLFEMLTGKVPFRGGHDAALLYSVVHEEPQKSTSLRADISAQLEMTIRKALEKEPVRRHQSMRELMADLLAAKSSAIELPKQEKSIVVLPFENLSPDPDQEYFSDGLTEEVISDLSAVRSLRVISRSSAMTFKRTRTGIPEIAKRLNVQYVLEGSVRKAGNSLRITAQLIDATSDAHLWAEKYSGTLDDVFDIQEKVSRSIVQALQLTLTPMEMRKIGEHPIQNIAAYECYMKAYAEIVKWTEEGSEQALRYFQNARDIIGDNSLIYSGMAWAYWNLVNIGVKQEEYVEQAEECVRKALKIDPDFPKALALLGWIRCAFQGKQQEAVHSFKHALKENPDEHLPLLGLATIYIWFLGKISAAVPLCQRLEQIEPLEDTTIIYSQVALPLFDGRFEEALKGSHRLYEMSPKNPFARLYYALLLIFVNNIEKGFAIIDRSAELMPDHSCTKLALLLKFAVKGERDRIGEVITPSFEKTCERDPDYSEQIASILARVGEKQEALRWLENAVNRGFINFPYLAWYNPLLENIRGEERFKKLMQRVKKEWEEFEV